MRRTRPGCKAGKKKRNPLLLPGLFFGITALAVVGILLLPSPDAKRQSGIELYGESPDVEVYGPELPQSTVGGYPVSVVENVVLPDSTDDEAEPVYVYASDDQECYHLPTCKFAYASGHKLLVSEAKLLGFKPCGLCNPPTE